MRVGPDERPAAAQPAGDWMLTASGRRFWPLDPRPEDVCIKDIAHALARTCRFGGHTRPHYTVAQHSVHVSQLVPPRHALRGLMHDAAEAYVGDVIRPIRRGVPEFGRIEARVMAAIAAALDLPPDIMVREVREADDAMLAVEAHRLLPAPPEPWPWPDLDILPDFKPWAPSRAWSAFMGRWRELKGKD